jgi:hypothetical protein
MKKLIVITVLFFAQKSFGQGVGIGTTSPDPSAVLHLQSTSQGLLLPNMTTTDRNAIINPASGLMVYDYVTKSIWMRSATTWQEMVTNGNNLWIEGTATPGDIYHSFNTGIGLPTPQNRLQVHHSTSQNNFIRVTNSLSGSTASDGLLIGANGNNASLINKENGALALGTNDDTVITITNTKRVGIGSTTPQAQLQVNGRASTTNPTILIVDSATSSGGFLKFKQLNNTNGMNIREESLSSFNNGQYLDILSDSVVVTTFTGNGRVGIRNISPAHALDINGDINTTGLLRVNGNAGVAGQVLTSNGAADPTWEAAAFSNNTRFSFGFTSFGANRTQDSVRFDATRYNTNTTDVFINVAQSRITINKTGLYHFDFGYYVEIGGFTPALDNMHIIWTLFNNSTRYNMVSNYRLSNLSPAPTTQFSGGQRLSIDLYCVAGSNIKLERFFNPGPGGAPSTFSFGDFTGYLISE